MNSAKYYQYCFCLDDREAYLIWIGNDQDSVMTTNNGKVICYLNSEALLEDANVSGLVIEPELPTLLNLDRLSTWLQKKDAQAVDCEMFLKAWNLFQDVATSINEAFDTDRKITNKIYEKLFFGNNLPAITPKGKKYQPTWTMQELKAIRKVMSNGLALFRENLIFS
jgi:type I restriction-modification system DNA methylase subunit